MASLCADPIHRVDGRTRGAGHLRALREELTRHIGGAPSVPQRLLIDRAARLHLRLEMLDAANAAAALDAALPIETEFRLTLRELGISNEKAA